MFDYTIYDETQCDFLEIVPASELPNGERLFVDIGDKPVVIFNIRGELYAVQDMCSHEELDLGDGDVEGYDLACPHHGAHFDLRTGKALTLPAVEDIPAYPVRIREGMIEIGMPK